MMEEETPFVMVDDMNNPPWGDDRTCPECGERNIPLSEATSDSGSGIILTFIAHCGGAWMRGPIRRK
jgi:hypothetical protein